MKLFHKHVRNHDQDRTLNEKYEMYLNSMRRINTNTTKPTNYNKLQVIYYHLGWVGKLQFIVIHLAHKQCGCNYHTNAIRTGHCITLI